MKKQIRFLRCENGAELIEAALIYPLVLLVISGLIYFGLFVLQYTTVSAYAQKIALIAAREVAYPGYVGLISQDKLEGSAIEVQLDDYSQAASSDVIHINTSVKDVNTRAYRYWSPDPLDTASFNDYQPKSTLTEMMTNMVEHNSIMVGKQSAEVDIQCENLLITQYVTVEVDQQLMNNQLLTALGYQNPTISVRAMATVNDTDEFIRNTDFVCDALEMLAQKLNIDVKSLRDKVTEFKEKLGLN